MKTNIKDKIRGSLIGGAIGDALGYPVEFLRYYQIIYKYGNEGLTQFVLDSKTGKAIISDDTQMLLYTAWGLIFSFTRGNLREKMDSVDEYIYKAYLCWLKTQENKQLSDNDYPRPWLNDVNELNVRRAPGMTCINALKSGVMGKIELPINNSKGCGTVMRVAPIGLYFSHDIAPLYGAKVAAITHGHPLAINSSALLVSIIAMILNAEINSKEQLINIINKSMSYLNDWFPDYQLTGENTELAEIILKAINLTYNNLEDEENIRQIGEGWVAEEALAIAIYCSVKYYNDFDKAIIASINHDGDSDSTGSITGNILGAIIGYELISDKWKMDLELHEVIIEIADDLVIKYSGNKDIENDEMWLSKYLYGKHPKYT